MPPLSFETPPETADWNLPITHADYTKLLAGHVPRDMDDKVWIQTEVPEAPSNTVLHIYHGWKAREVLRIEIAAGDANDTEAREWASIVKIWWRKEYKGEEDMTEGEAKMFAVNTCNYVLGCGIERGDGAESEAGEEVDGDEKGED
ncbi:hypothetical protein B5807_00525 [Epicoccum nigrum]|uniref:Uncharacterized protein n=1 Tax=Epicoccum nigrum TaxID=105696 RepID=A0A1Y2MES4_EPING|nr:hypothetical protein B5807_00525 [Epicoccum nigrum]